MVPSPKIAAVCVVREECTGERARSHSVETSGAGPFSATFHIHPCMASTARFLAQHAESHELTERTATQTMGIHARHGAALRKGLPGCSQDAKNMQSLLNGAPHCTRTAGRAGSTPQTRLPGHLAMAPKIELRLPDHATKMMTRLNHLSSASRKSTSVGGASVINATD